MMVFFSLRKETHLEALGMQLKKRKKELQFLSLCKRVCFVDVCCMIFWC